jgi:hypothetical protein
MKPDLPDNHDGADMGPDLRWDYHGLGLAALGGKGDNGVLE